jgi:hypothetical protein
LPTSITSFQESDEFKKEEQKTRGGRGALADLDHVDYVIKAIKIFGNLNSILS